MSYFEYNTKEKIIKILNIYRIILSYLINIKIFLKENFISLNLKK